MLVRDDPEATAAAHEPVVRRIAAEHRVRRATARRWFVELVRFLDLCAGSAMVHAPSRKVDKAWHEFVLCTRDYAAFCERRYGEFVHHDPSEVPDRDAYVRTWTALQQQLGEAPDRRIWPHPSRSRFAGGAACAGGFGFGGDAGSSCGGGGCGGGGGGS